MGEERRQEKKRLSSADSRANILKIQREDIIIMTNHEALTEDVELELEVRGL